MGLWMTTSWMRSGALLKGDALDHFLASITASLVLRPASLRTGRPNESHPPRVTRSIDFLHRFGVESLSDDRKMLPLDCDRQL